MTSPFDRLSDDTPVYVISVAAQLSGLHPQTLRAYDRLGLVSPGRAAGRGRRYSMRDILVLREVQRLSQDEGVNLSGIKRILELAAELERSQQAGRRTARRDRAAARRARIHQGGRRPAGRAAQEPGDRRRPGPGAPGAQARRQMDTAPDRQRDLTDIRTKEDTKSMEEKLTRKSQDALSAVGAQRGGRRASAGRPGRTCSPP